MVETKFECATCKIEHNELWSFGQYGNNPLKVLDRKDYCQMHFEKAEALHNACLESYRAIEVPEVTLEEYSLIFANN